MGQQRRHRLPRVARVLVAALLPSGALGARLHATPPAKAGNLRVADAPASNSSAPVIRSMPANVSLPVAAAAVNATMQKANSTANTTLPFTANVDPAIGKVFGLYYSSYSDAKATSVEARGALSSATRNENPFISNSNFPLGAQQLPAPGCPLQLKSQTNYPTDRRKANLRLAEHAICDYLYGRGESLPSCGGSVCELEVFVPMPSSDEMQEPWIGASMALAAYSQICSLMQSNPYYTDKCKVHRAFSAISAGMELSVSGSSTSVGLTGLTSSGLLQLKLDDAYILRMSNVYLAANSESAYHQTDFYNDLSNVLKWQHEPPAVHFCSSLSCLISKLMPQHG